MSLVELQNPASDERASTVIRLRPTRGTATQWERIRRASDDYARLLADVERRTSDPDVRALREGADSAAELALERIGR